MRNLTERQQRILEFFEEFLDERSYPPTVRDIQRGCDISSTSVVSYNIEILKREGLIRKDDGVSRGLGIGFAPSSTQRPGDRRRSRWWVPSQRANHSHCPLPKPGPAQQISIPWTCRNRSPAAAEGLYALNVKGESMIDALIADGDLVIMQQTNSVPNGEMAAVRIAPDDETTLKRFYAEGSVVRLQPENSQMEPIILSADKVEVLSRVVAVWRYRG